MKTRTIIVFYLILVLIGIALTGFPQGIVNDGGYITGSSSSYVKVSGSGDAWLINGNADQVSFGNLIVDFTGSGLYSLSVSDTSYITVTGNLTLNDTLRLKADSTSMASLITNGSVIGTKAVVEQYIKDDQWHMVSPPVASAVSGVYTGSYLAKWNEPDSTWTYVSSTTDPLAAGHGYFVWASSSLGSPEHVEFTGQLNTGNMAVSGMTYNPGSGKGDGWNLLGNPYPCALEWTSSWTTSGIDATIYIYDGVQYKTWNYNLGGYGTLGNGYIPSTQGFWVKANSSSPSLTIPASERTHQSQQFYKAGENTEAEMLTVTLTGNGMDDKLVVGWIDSATDGFDHEFDAYKLDGIEQAPSIRTLANGEELSVSLIAPPKNKTKWVEVVVSIPEGGMYKLDFGDLETVDHSVNIYLWDKVAPNPETKWVDMRKLGVYKFEAEPGENQHRFRIFFEPKNDGNSITVSQGDQIAGAEVWTTGHSLFVHNKDLTGADVEVYSLLGQKVFSARVNPESLEEFMINVKKGYYIVKLHSSHSLLTHKVFFN
ncbi:MAG: hypothetical protein Kow00127_17410 [Bacteroidales bacterium]